MEGEATTRPATAEDQQLFQVQLKKANAGDAEAIAWLKEFLNANPQLWQQLGNLARSGERAWIELISNGSRLTAECITNELRRLKSDLIGGDASPMEILLGDTILTTWLETRHLEARSATSGGSTGQANILLKRLESAQRRHVAAIKSLAQLRKLLPRSAAPAPLKIFEEARTTG